MNGQELALELEEKGYDWIKKELAVDSHQYTKSLQYAVGSLQK